MNKKLFLKGTLILIIGNIITKTLGFIYRVYIANAIGAEGMGLFQLVFPLFVLVMTVTTSGLSMAVSNLVAQESAKKNIGTIRRLVKLGIVIVFIFSFFLSALLYFKLQWIASSLLKDPRTYLSLLILLPCIPIITATSIVKGYFYGLKNMLPSALSQLIEQIIRISIAYSMLSFLKQQSLALACAYATLGMMAGELAGCAYIFYMYKKDSKSLKNQKCNRYIPSNRVLVRSLLSISIPISMSRLVTSLLQTVETLIIPGRLQLMGLSHSDAMATFGKISGMAMPLIFFPAMITMALATNLIPAISEAKTLKQFDSVKKATYLSIQFTVLMGALSFGIFYFLGPTMGKIFFDSAGVGMMLQTLSFVCIFLYLENTLFGILNGLQQQITVLTNGIIGSLIRLAGMYFFIPTLGIKAILYSFVISMTVTCILNLRKVVAITGIALDFGRWFLLPIGCTVVTGLILLIFSTRFTWMFTATLPHLIILSAVYTLLYSLFIITVGGISFSEFYAFKPSK